MLSEAEYEARALPELRALIDALDACGGRYGLVVLTGAMGVGGAMVVERQ